MARVSIIMGVFNCHKTEAIDLTLKSIINQTYTDWEFIICDDGSTDRTFEYFKKYESVDERIKVIGYKENCGLATALNACIDVAEGEYIARQDVEDISYPQRLEKEVFFLDNHPEYDLVGCNASMYSDKDGRWGDYLNKEIPTAKDFLWTTQFLHPTVVFRKESLIRAGKYRVSKETKRCQDYDLFMRMYSLGMKGYNLQEVLFDYYHEIGFQQNLTWERRLEEMKLRAIGFKALGLMPRALPYVLKPLIVKLVPKKIYAKLKKSEGANSVTRNKSDG